jgi:hypothetical protein
MTGRSIQAGLVLTNQHPLGSDPVRGLAEQIEMLHVARDGGWDSVWVAQH